MAFLFQDQNQGTRNDFSHPQMRGAAATVLFHPDFNRRLRIHTESADPFFSGSPEKKALAGLGYVTLTAGGDSHPALRTSAARLGNLSGLCRTGAVPARTFTMGNPHVPMTPERNWAILQRSFGRKLTIKAGTNALSRPE